MPGSAFRGSPRDPLRAPPRDPFRAHPRADHGRPPRPPAGQGPVLAWCAPDTRRAPLRYLTTLLGLTALTACYAVLVYGTADARSMAGTWWLWLVLAALSAPALHIGGVRCAAGSDWLSGGTDQWVRVRELRSVTIHPATEPAEPAESADPADPADPEDPGDTLTLSDRDGRTVRLPVTVARHHPVVWDILRRGVAHSRTTGATVDDQATALLARP